MYWLDCLLIHAIAFPFPTVTIAIRCQQFDTTLMFDTMPVAAQKLWNDYILNVWIYT